MVNSTPVCTIMHNNSLRVAVLSGKGGTGKTLVAVNLAWVAGKSTYIDCDVEEPNGLLFFKPIELKDGDVTVKIPYVVGDLCSGCRKCVDFCRLNALAFICGKPFVFEEICHSCGGCVLICAEKALLEKDKVIGTVQRGISGEVEVFTGVLNTGESSGIPIIKELLAKGFSSGSPLTFIDCPPGSACVVMESIKGADYCVLVAEPTLFGVHNLNMVYELVKLFNKPFGAVLNKCVEGDDPAEAFCVKKDIHILGKIPFDNELGRISSDAMIAAREDNRYKMLFLSLLDNVLKEVRH